MSLFDRTSTTDEVIEGVSLAGRCAVVTGGSSGLGVETARALASAGADVLMLARDRTKLEAAADGVRERVPAARVSTGLMDLADLDSVRSAAARIAREHPRINLLVITPVSWPVP